MPVPTPRASLSLVPPLPVHPQDKLQPGEGDREREEGEGEREREGGRGKTEREEREGGREMQEGGDMGIYVYVYV